MCLRCGSCSYARSVGMSSASSCPIPRLAGSYLRSQSREEVARLIDASSDLFERALLMVLYGTGMRRSEVARLKIADIDSLAHGHSRSERQGRQGSRLAPESEVAGDAAELLGCGSSRRHTCSPRACIATQSNRSPTRPCGRSLQRSGQEGRHPQDGDAPFSSSQLGNPSAGSKNRPARIKLLLGHEDLESNGEVSASVRASPSPSRQPHRRTEPLEPRPEPPGLSSSASLMTRPAIEVADIVRAKGRRYLEHYQSSVSYQQLKAYRAVERLPHRCSRRTQGQVCHLPVRSTPLL